MISFIILLSLYDNIIWYKCYQFLNLDLFTVFKKYIKKYIMYICMLSILQEKSLFLVYFQDYYFII